MTRKSYEIEIQENFPDCFTLKSFQLKFPLQYLFPPLFLTKSERERNRKSLNIV